MLRKKDPLLDLDIPDDYSHFLLVRQIYLTELAKLVLLEGKNDVSKLYNEIPISETLVSENAIRLFPKIKNDLGQNVSYLVAAEYIRLISNSNDKKNMYVVFTAKGWIAATGGEFKQQHDERQTSLRNLQLTKESIKAYKHQKLINFWLITATILTALIPLSTFIIEKTWFNEKVEILHSTPTIQIYIDSSTLNKGDTELKIVPQLKRVVGARNINQ